MRRTPLIPLALALCGLGGLAAAAFALGWSLSAPPAPPARVAAIEAETEPGVELAVEAPVVPGEIRLGEFSPDIAGVARELLARPRPPPGFRDDCSGFATIAVGP